MSVPQPIDSAIWTGRYPRQRRRYVTFTIVVEFPENSGDVPEAREAPVAEPDAARAPIFIEGAISDAYADSWRPEGFAGRDL